MSEGQTVSVHPYVVRIFSKGFGFLLLAFWCLVTGAIAIGIPLQALSPILAWVLFFAGLLMLLGV